VKASTIDEAEATRQTLAFLADYSVPKASPLCGNSICQDRRFMANTMPELEAFFHYRNLDVSTLKELAQRWRPEIMTGLKKKATHQALDDIRESIEELRYYREHFIGSKRGQSGYSPALCWVSAHTTCSRTISEACAARAFNAPSTASLVGAFPKPTARLRSQHS
jgi:hypothetical protein